MDKSLNAPNVMPEEREKQLEIYHDKFIPIFFEWTKVCPSILSSSLQEEKHHRPITECSAVLLSLQLLHALPPKDPKIALLYGKDISDRIQDFPKGPLHIVAAATATKLNSSRA
jgi:hypothetical protein